jgi:hypothetical protein
MKDISASKSRRFSRYFILLPLLMYIFPSATWLDRLVDIQGDFFL